MIGHLLDAAGAVEVVATIHIMDSHLSGQANNDSSKLTRVQFPVDSSFRDWTELLPDLLDIIVSKLYQFPDYLRFCGVCLQWRLVALKNANNAHKQWLDIFKASRFKLPMLMIKTEENNNDRRGLYSVSDGITYNLKLPLPCRNRFIGSSHGWLLCIEGGEVITLLNPLTNTCISLPRFEDDMYVKWKRKPEYYMMKGILTENPHVSPDNYAVAIIYGGDCKLLTYKSGDMHWKTIGDDLLGFYDVVCYKTDIYGYTATRKLVQIDVDSGRAKVILNKIDSLPFVDYLVESQEDLLLVRRSWAVMYKKGGDHNADSQTEDEGNIGDLDDPYSRPVTYDFKVNKLKRENESADWVEIDDIRNQALFVGDNHSISVSTVEFPGCRSNSIYFTNHYSQWTLSYTCFGPDEDSGFFSLDDKTVHPHHLLDLCELHMKAPIWFVPSFAMSA